MATFLFLYNFCFSLKHCIAPLLSFLYTCYESVPKLSLCFVKPLPVCPITSAIGQFFNLETSKSFWLAPEGSGSSPSILLAVPLGIGSLLVSHVGAHFLITYIPFSRSIPLFCELSDKGCLRSKYYEAQAIWKYLYWRCRFNTQLAMPQNVGLRVFSPSSLKARLPASTTAIENSEDTIITDPL